MTGIEEREPVRIGSLSKFVDIVVKARSGGSKTFVYRGHGEASWDLQPAIFRDSRWFESERLILRRLISVQPHEFAGDRRAFDLLVRAQHHGLPTRLLDVTTNPLVALYFACVNHQSAKKDGKVFQIEVGSEIVKYYDSDAVSCVSNLCHLSSKENREIAVFIADIIRRAGKVGETVSSRLFDEGTVIIDFNKIESTKRLVQFIREEKSFFEERITPLDLVRPYLVFPLQSNRRIVAQAGAFIAFGLTKKLSIPYRGALGLPIKIEEFLVPHSKKFSIIEDLLKFSISKGTLFPDLEHAADYIRFDSSTTTFAQRASKDTDLDIDL